MRKFIRTLIFGILTTSCILMLAGALIAQTEPPELPHKPKPDKDTSHKTEPPALPKLAGRASEKAIGVSSNVSLGLCVNQGNLKINGWKRNEVRVYVDGGNKFGFKVLEKHAKTGEPVWVMVVAEGSGGAASDNDCIWGNNIEIDAPSGSSINLKERETYTAIDGVRKVSVKNVGGDISLRNISDGVTASTYRGDLTVESSSGAISLESTTGNILAFGVGPSEIGDIFKAKSNSGRISLQKVQHRQIEVSTISGTLAYMGDLLNGGSYNFNTSNGEMRLLLPRNASCLLTAIYGFGRFRSDLPVKIFTENIEPGSIKKVNGQIGTVDSSQSASLKMTTNSGNIAIQKQ